MKRFLSLYHPKLPVYLTYMLQQVEYHPNNFLGWIIRFPNLNKIMYRKSLTWTIKSKILVSTLFILRISQIILALVIIIYSSIVLGLLLFFSVPILVILEIYLIVGLGWIFIEGPSRKKQVNKSKQIFSRHPGLKVAILGSYGKTTMKELLRTVLSNDKKIAATPGNKNVPISHARFASKLNGGEEVLLLEYGEAAPGDIAKFAENTLPDMAVVTGIAPNHLDRYKTFENVIEDILSIKNYVEPKNIYANANIKNALGDDLSTIKFLKTYDERGTSGIRIKNIELSLSGMKFSAIFENGEEIKMQTKLIGRHLLGPLSVCILIAKNLGISSQQIQQGISRTKPFEHRMMPRSIGGAVIIDDTYNGSVEGFRAGLELLKEVEAKRKIYVTPGLVDQGKETENVHKEIGRLIAKSNPDKVVLMKNSVSSIIEKSLEENKYSGELEIRDDPLEFYTNLEHTLAAGDVILLQNDWTDNYA